MTQGWLFPEDEINDPHAIQAEVKEPEFCTAVPERKVPRPKRKQESLFTKEELVQPPLTAEEKDNLIRRLITNARLGARYMYRAKEVCSMLRITYDEIQTLLNYYKLFFSKLEHEVRWESSDISLYCFVQITSCYSIQLR